MNSRKKRYKKRLKTWQKAIILFVEVALLCVVTVVWFALEKFDKITVKEIDREFIATNINEEIYEKNEELKGYTNYLLLGTDARDNSFEAMNTTGEGNTDAIIIASINNDTKEVRLVSVYRDTLLFVPGGKSEFSDTYRKATEAFFYSGVEATISMINSNLDLDIKDFVMVNFEALIEIIDAVGGIELEIDENELYWINEYLRDTGLNTGRTYENVPHDGLVHLDGIQATAYCRIRYDKNLDYGRAERQRKVISLVFEKAKKMDVVQLNAAINSVIDNIVLSIPKAEILDMARFVFDYNLVGQTGFPFDKFGSIKKVPEVDIADPVFCVTLESNVSKLHQYLFNKVDYEPTKKVKEISDYLEMLFDKNNYPDNVYQ